MNAMARIGKKKEPMTQKERSAKSALKRAAKREVEIRLSVCAGTKIALDELMVWSELEEQGEALTLAIHHLHGKGTRSVVQTLEYQLTIGETPRPECIRLRARPGTIHALKDLMVWTGIEERGHFVEVMIKRLHQIGKADAIPLLTPPRHEIKLTEKVAARLRQVGREESLMLELDE